MARQQAEGSNRLSVFWLKKHGYLSQNGGWRYGSIKWTYGSGSESSIGFSVFTKVPDEADHIQLQYTHTNNQTGEKENMDYRVLLASTPCRYGGIRYWFICPLTKNGRYCGRRVGVIYSIGKWFGCRYCGNIAYQSQFEGGRHKGFISIPDIERAEKEVKRYYYRGVPTRKYRKVERLNDKFNYSLIRAAGRLDLLAGLHK